MKLDAAESLQWTWKTDSMRAMAVEICRLALARGTQEFSANDLPDFNHGGPGIAGAIFHRLVADGILSRVGTFEGTTFYPKVVANPGGNKIGLYRLKNSALANLLLQRHAKEPVLKQQELLTAETRP